MMASNIQPHDSIHGKSAEHDIIEPLYENGRSYTLSDSLIPHKLPSPEKLKPSNDRIVGHIDKWPANLNIGGKTTSKPKFLTNLENYLQRELKKLNYPQHPSEQRLHAYREVFDYLINSFCTYKPLFTAIKHEYEGVIEKQKSTIQELDPLKELVLSINEKCEQKILHFKQEEKSDIVALKNEKLGLENTNKKLRDEIASMNMQVKKCQEEVAKEYERFRTESAARRLLLQDLNDLKYGEDHSKQMKEGGMENPDEDPVIMKIALKQARIDLASKTQKLAEVLADYGDVVPRRDYEKLEYKHQKMESEYEEIKNSHETLISENKVLLEDYERLKEERDEFSTNCENMRLNATPRPDWNKCALYVDGGYERWQRLSADKSTNIKVDLLLAEMTGHDLATIEAGENTVKMFEPKGTGSDIPQYLQSAEQVRNRHIKKRDLCMLIKDIWQAKETRPWVLLTNIQDLDTIIPIWTFASSEEVKAESSSPFSKHIHMVDFLHSYLKQTFPTGVLATEWGYNLHDGCLRYSHDEKVKFFADVINQEADEEIYYMSLNLLGRLFTALSELDKKQTGVMTVTQFEEVLVRFFPHNNVEEISTLKKFAEQELGGFEEDKVSYREIFTEDDEGDNGPFITYIHSLEKSTKKKLVEEIEVCFEGKSEITLSELTSTLRAVDAGMSTQECQHVTDFVFRLHETKESNDVGETDKTMEKDLMMKKLNNIAMRRH